MKRICKYCGKTYEGDPGSAGVSVTVEQERRVRDGR